VALLGGHAMSGRYDDMREWLNESEDLAALSRESVWRRPLTDAELLAIGVAWLACTAALIVFGAVVLRW
jgi:hypothetical protein